MVRNPPPGPDGQEIQMVGVDCSIIMNPKVWVASGHMRPDFRTDGPASIAANGIDASKYAGDALRKSILRRELERAKRGFRGHRK